MYSVHAEEAARSIRGTCRPAGRRTVNGTRELVCDSDLVATTGRIVRERQDVPSRVRCACSRSVAADTFPCCGRSHLECTRHRPSFRRYRTRGDVRGHRRQDSVSGRSRPTGRSTTMPPPKSDSSSPRSPHRVKRPTPRVFALRVHLGLESPPHSCRYLCHRDLQITERLSRKRVSAGASHRPVLISTRPRVTLEPENPSDQRLYGASPRIRTENLRILRSPRTRSESVHTIHEQAFSARNRVS